MTYRFELVLDGPDPTDEDNVDALYEAFCGNVEIGRSHGVGVLEFSGEAPSFSAAVVSAIATAEAAVEGLRVVRVGPDEQVTASEIAVRTGRSRESIRLLYSGRRGPGFFPGPAALLSDNTHLWRWIDVAEWFRTNYGTQLETPDPRTLEIVNAVLALRRQAEANEPLGAELAAFVNAKLGEVKRLRKPQRGRVAKAVSAKPKPAKASLVKAAPAKAASGRAVAPAAKRVKRRVAPRR